MYICCMCVCYYLQYTCWGSYARLYMKVRFTGIRKFYTHKRGNKGSHLYLQLYYLQNISHYCAHVVAGVDRSRSRLLEKGWSKLCIWHDREDTYTLMWECQLKGVWGMPLRKFLTFWVGIWEWFITALVGLMC